MRAQRGSRAWSSAHGRKKWLVAAGGLCMLGLAGALVVGLWPGTQDTANIGEEGIALPAFGVAGTRHEVQLVEMATAASEFEAPETMPVYRIVPSEAPTRESIDRMATLLGLGGERQYGSDGVTDSRIGIHFPRAEDASCFYMRDQRALAELEEQFRQGEAIELPSSDEAQEIADQTLEQLGLLSGLVCYKVSVCDRFTMTSLEGPDRSCDVTLAVMYRASVGGLPLVGPGAKVYVILGPEGKIIEVRHYAQRDVEAGKVVKLRDVSAAVDDLKQGLGLAPRNLTEENCRSVVVEEVQLGYYAAPVPMGLSEYKPVYLLTVRLADGSAGQWVVSGYEGTVLPVSGG